MSMKEALRRQRGKGVDISIVLGQPDGVNSSMHGDHKPVDEDSEVAPEVANESQDVKEKMIGDVVPGMEMMDENHPDKAQDIALLAELLGKDSLLARHKK